MGAFVGFFTVYKLDNNSFWPAGGYVGWGVDVVADGGRDNHLTRHLQGIAGIGLYMVGWGLSVTLPQLCRRDYLD